MVLCSIDREIAPQLIYAVLAPYIGAEEEAGLAESNP
jgi:hypothetical protein